MDWMMEVLADPGARVDARILAAIRLGESGDLGMVARLEAMRDDRTPYDSGFGPARQEGDPDETLGQYVTRAIEEIQARTANASNLRRK
jgi:hypothetical protein